LNEAFVAAFGGEKAKASAHHKKYRSLLKHEMTALKK
jgi:hypothetical protein